MKGTKSVLDLPQECKLDLQLSINLKPSSLTSITDQMSHEKHIGSPTQYTERDDVGFPASGEPSQHMSVGRYLATRISSLKPPMDRLENPFTLLGLLNRRQWAFFFVAFFGWT